MLNDLTAVIYSSGAEWKPDSIKFPTTDRSDLDLWICVKGQDTIVSRVRETTSLGVKVAGRTDEMAEVEYRVSLANKAFHKYAE